MGKTRKLLASQKHRRFNVQIENSQRDLPLKKRLIADIIGEVLEFLKVDCSEITVYFVTKKKISSLHNQFFQDPTPTDCISFPLQSEHLGEIFVCPKVAIEYTKGVGSFEETILYVVHGILHLIGYDDLKPKDKQEMRCMEKKCMDHLKLSYVLK